MVVVYLVPDGRINWEFVDPYTLFGGCPVKWLGRGTVLRAEFALGGSFPSSVPNYQSCYVDWRCDIIINCSSRLYQGLGEAFVDRMNQFLVFLFITSLIATCTSAVAQSATAVSLFIYL